jgi:hypothetical protein
MKDEISAYDRFVVNMCIMTAAFLQHLLNTHKSLEVVITELLQRADSINKSPIENRELYTMVLVHHSLDKSGVI